MNSITNVSNGGATSAKATPLNLSASTNNINFSIYPDKLTELGVAAIKYAQHGYKVFPCKPSGKKPLTVNGFHNATTDIAQVIQWWTMYPDANIGLCTEDLIVVDIDGERGTQSIALWETEHGTLPKTATTRTGSGGKHLSYKTKKPVRCRVAVLDDVDIRAQGGYIVVPPSIHESGKQYEWLIPLSEIVEATDAVLSLAAHQVPKSKTADIISEGQRNNALFSEACRLQAKGANPEQIAGHLTTYNQEHCQPPIDAAELATIIDSAVTYPLGFTLETTKTGDIRQSIANVRTVLAGDERLRCKIRWNELTHAITVDGELPWGGKSGREWNNADDSQLLAFMETYGLTKEKSVLVALCNEAHDNSYHPIRDLLQSLEWDGVPRMATVFTKYLGCDNTPYTRAVSELFWFGAVGRALKPGTKYDHVPILVGKQGGGKSLFLKKACILQQHFCDTFSSFEGKAAAERLRGMWIVELSELLALKRTQEVEAFKSFLTSTVDVYRPAYGRRTEQYPRMAVFCGTTNNKDFLTDQSGNRRFLPLLCHPERVEKEDILQGWEQLEVTEYFTQVWAEAYHRYTAEYPKLILPKELKDEAFRQQEEYTEENLLPGQIQKYLETRPPAYGKYVTSLEIAAEVLGINNPTKKQAREIHDALRAVDELDFVKKQKTFYGNQRAYVIKER